jgi:hypothetical protein
MFMTTIDRVLFPFALFLIYYGIALWCLHQAASPLTASSIAIKFYLLFAELKYLFSPRSSSIKALA